LSSAFLDNVSSFHYPNKQLKKVGIFHTVYLTGICSAGLGPFFIKRIAGCPYPVRVFQAFRAIFRHWPGGKVRPTRISGTGMGRPFLFEETGADPRIPQTGRGTKGKGAEAARQETVSIEESQDPGKASSRKTARRERPGPLCRALLPGRRHAAKAGSHPCEDSACFPIRTTPKAQTDRPPWRHHFLADPRPDISHPRAQNIICF